MKKNFFMTLLLTIIIAMGIKTYSINAADDYPDEFKYPIDERIPDKWDFFPGECTSWVAHCLNSRNGIEFNNKYKGVRWSHAKYWISVAKSVGITVDSNPAVGSVACWTDGKYGHVAYVVAVNDDEVIIEEYNYKIRHKYGTRNIKETPPDGYIHFKDLECPHYLDLNWNVDGEKEWYDVPCATVDLYINGKKIEGIRDFCELLEYGSTYEIKNIKTNNDYQYDGVICGSLKGTIGNEDSEVILSFSKKKSSEKWKHTYKGTWTYALIPDGFDMTHSLATKYKSQKLTPYSYYTQKLEITESKVIGWIYYHWTWNNGERYSYNCFISTEKKYENNRDYQYFTAFDSTKDHGHYNENGVYGGEDCYYRWFGNPSDGSHWWFRIPIVRQSYTLYTKY